MKKRFLLLISFLLISNFCIFNAAEAKPVPDEGMWLPIFVKDLNYQTMKDMGLKLTAEQIYSINNSSLKDAIVNFGNFCTAEVVSDKGLLFTNHHCGYSAIQQHSSVNHDYLTDGFWANSFEEELPCEGLTATFFVRMEDVTERILSKVTDEMTEEERSKAIREEAKKIEEENSQDGRYFTEVNSLFAGNEYYLFVYEVYKDIRMVGAPPSSIGKFGGDTDNWMWPRQTGDFSIFRVYADKDNNPAEYSEDNVPYTPKHVLPISIKGIEKDDFAMIWGYPGSTDRYLTSYGVKHVLEIENPAIDEIFGVILTNMKKGMERSQAVNIMYASNYASYANMYKNKQGLTRGLKRLKIYNKKQALENKLRAWLRQNPEQNKKYGECLSILDKSYKELTESKFYSDVWNLQGAFIGSKILNNSLNIGATLSTALSSDISKEERTATLESLKAELPTTYEEYDQWTEETILREIIRHLYAKYNNTDNIESFNTIKNKYQGDVDKYVDDILAKSIFANQQNLEAFINKPNAKKLSKDPINKLSSEFIGAIMGQQMGVRNIFSELRKGERLFIAALREMDSEKAYYPDANFTMRLTYGKILDYYPADAIHYDYYTTLEGVMEKEDPNDEEFIVPSKLKQLFLAKDYGEYADNKTGKMHVCFLSDNDITGGNSGSPVLNGNGELIGLAFDGNWEAMSGDITFEPDLQRTISVDVRYVLFIIDKYAGCQRIIDELNIVR